MGTDLYRSGVLVAWQLECFVKFDFCTYCTAGRSPVFGAKSIKHTKVIPYSDVIVSFIACQSLYLMWKISSSAGICNFPGQMEGRFLTSFWSMYGSLDSVAAVVDYDSI